MIGWLHCASGVSGDMLLGALVDAGVPLARLQAAVDEVAPAPVVLRAEHVTRAGLAATKVHVDGVEAATHRTWRDIRSLLEGARFAGRETALRTFAALADAEASAHGTRPEDVHFHEVGALDAIADIVGVCAGFAHLDLTGLTVSPVALGGGSVPAAHGRLPVPGPAVVALLAGRPTHGGPAEVELTTPTGAALAATLGTGWGPQPAMRVATCGSGAGDRDLPGGPNFVRLLLGEPAGVTAAVAGDGGPDVVVETNVDDLDPRLWPGVLAALLAVGADDAWTVPILMKKGRPAHTLRVLTPAGHADAVRRVIFTQTSAIGVREHPVAKHALDRGFTEVHVDGRPVRIKTARWEGRTVNAQPEWEDVAAVARATGQPAKHVLARAAAAYWATENRPDPASEVEPLS
ncbi:nickel pincer cofactor biosynthesis protein LarC [Streptomyces sp. NPDC047028]|uniref:nickel pincer cofactor biosynthesis protein LarC n=1 Tax=Streptomyces sp. NPDC047028 TaxID=3155793 RepID=UPI0033D89755